MGHSRPTGTDHHITLYAFNGTAQGGNLNQLWSAVAGSWPGSGNANLVPTVSNGRVYVASYKNLSIFGLFPVYIPHPPPPVIKIPIPPPDPEVGAHYWGTVTETTVEKLVITLRDNRTLTVDISAAQKAGTVYIPPVGGYVEVLGSMNSSGVLMARSTYRAKEPASWGVDKSQ